MKRYLFALLAVVIGLIFSSGCEKNFQSYNSETEITQQQTILKGFGIEIDEASGQVTIFHDGQPVGLGKLGDAPVINGDISGNVTLEDIKYTAKGCGGNPTDLIREISVEFKNKSGSPTYQYIVPQNVTGLNLDGAGGYVDTDVAPDETFFVVLQVKLTTCAKFSIFFDLYDTF